MSSRENLNILEALDNLATLAEIESLNEIEVSENLQIIAHTEKDESETVQYWADEQAVEAIKETFRVVYRYLRSFYERMHQTGDTQRLIEGTNTIMVLVGEAGKKLERFSNLFQQKMTHTKEYRDLQNFYRNKVIKETYSEFAKKPILPEDVKDAVFVSEFLEEAPLVEKTTEPIYILDDIDIVKKDTHYELFYLKNEEGREFYTPLLARSIKLACDFGKYSEEYFSEDPLLQIKNWDDKSLQLLAKSILERNHSLIEAYYKKAMTLKNMELIQLLNKALMALMLAANPRNLIRQFAVKGSHRYFLDFQLFLRDVLLSREYQKFWIYSVPAGQPYFHKVLDLVQAICLGLYTIGKSEEELQASLKQIIQNGDHDLFATDSLAEFISKSDEIYQNALKRHPNGPLFKAVDVIREEEEKIFDPILQDNLSGPQFHIKWGDKECTLLRLPSPTRQQFIHRVEIGGDFKAFLRAILNQKNENKYLIFNFQDRTSWREHPRALALEEIQKNAEFAKELFVVTLPKDTDFYWQSEEYAELNNAEEFKLLCLEQLQDETTGFYFSSTIRKILFPDLCHTLIEAIHKELFGQASHLSREERLNFIELIYLGIELLLFDQLEPRFISFVSKDSLDVGCCEAVAFAQVIKQMQNQEWSAQDKEALLAKLYGPALTVRERALLPERIERFIHMLTAIEGKPSNWIASQMHLKSITVIPA